MAKSKYESIVSNISKLLRLHGEFTFLSSANTFLKKDTYSLIQVIKLL
jgi:hypothetical protein